MRTESENIAKVQERKPYNTPGVIDYGTVGEVTGQPAPSGFGDASTDG